MTTFRTYSVCWLCCKARQEPIKISPQRNICLTRRRAGPPERVWDLLRL